MATRRRFIVRTTRCAIIAIFSACFLAGCGGEESTKVDMTANPAPTEFKGMLGDQMKNAKIKESPAAPPAKK
jgi:hypothetical protein